MDQQAGTSYVDEEECLGFKIWVAELELVVGSSRGSKKADPAQTFLLLQKLATTVDRTDRSEIREYQRRCENALIDILLKGAPPPVRRLVCEALGKLYARGDQLPLFARVSTLQLFLGTKEAYGKETSEDVRLGALELTTALYYTQGRSLSIGVRETAALAVKYCGKGSSDNTRRAALRLLAAAIEGVGGSHRHAADVQSEALKAIERVWKEKDLGQVVKLGIADALRAIAAVGGAQLWSNGLSSYELARSVCLAGVQDPSSAVRGAYARALGEMVTAASSDEGIQSMATFGTKGKQKQTQERALTAVFDQCFLLPFSEAAAAGDRPMCTALAQAWVWHLRAMRQNYGLDELEFVGHVMMPFEALQAAVNLAGTTPEKGRSGGDAELGMGLAGGERPHAQACILYIVRAGGIDLLGEAGQRSVLGHITALLSGNKEEGINAPTASSSSSFPAVKALSFFGEVSTPVAIVALEAIAVLIEAQGEVGPEGAAPLERVIATKLVGSHAALRIQAASALATLAVAEPGSAARLLGSALANLRSAADVLVENASGGPDRSRGGPGTPRGLGTGRLKSHMNALHGWALGVAALLAVIPRLPLGLPSHYLQVAVKMAAALIEAPRSQLASAKSMEREAGYVLLGSLCKSAISELIAAYGDAVLSLWVPALGRDAAAVLATCASSREAQAAETLAAEAWWRATALQALAALITGGYICPSSTFHDDRKLRAITDLLRPTLTAIRSHSLLSSPTQARGGSGSSLAGALAMLQLRLLQAFAQLPAQVLSAASPYFSGAHAEQLVATCLDGIKDVLGAPFISLDAFGPTLRRALHPEDDHLGPWPGGRDPLERALLRFEGVAGGPNVSPWEIGATKATEYSLMGQLTSKVEASTVYPQSISLGAALFAVRSELLGGLLRASPPAVKNSILDELLSLAQSFHLAKKKDRDAPKRVATVVAAAAPVLSGFAVDGQMYAANDKTTAADVPEKIKALADAAAADASAGILLQRITSELYGIAARVSGDAISPAILRVLCRESAETASLPHRAALTLAIGAAARAVGGLGLAAVLPLAVDTLCALAPASDSSIAPVTLHALVACAHAAGPAFAPYVKASLGLMQTMLLHEDIYAIPGLLPAVGRLENSLVAALGPDYMLGSAAYDACRTVVAELRAPDASGVRLPEDTLAAALESVLYTQMMVLFAPAALPAAAHVAVLIGTLPSRQPQLRRAAADTLRHLAERDTAAVLAQKIEPALISALDGETTSGTAMQLQTTLVTLLVAGAANEPSRWISLFGGVIAATGPGDKMFPVGAPSRSDLSVMRTSAANGTHTSSDGNDGEMDEISSSDKTEAAQTKTPPQGLATLGPSDASSGNGAPRLRTKAFAARCLLRVPELACAADPRHSDALAAHYDPLSSDWLVLHTQALVDLGFRMATGQMESLRSVGVELLGAMLACLGEARDPLAPQERLLAQYQAQYVSALRASLAPEASPAVAASGAALAAAFFEKGLAEGDATVMERLMGLLCAPLSGWASGSPDGAQAAYADWVAARARIAVLESHAHCAALAARGGSDQGIVLRAQGPFFTLLVDCWIGLLHDRAMLEAMEAASHSKYRLSLYGKMASGASAPLLSSVASGIATSLQRAWPAALDAAAATLVLDRTVSHGALGKKRHAALLDLLAVAADGRWATDGVKDVGPTLLRCLLRLTSSRFVKSGWVTSLSVTELVPLVRALGRSAGLAGSTSLPGSKERTELAASVLQQLALVRAEEDFSSSMSSTNLSVEDTGMLRFGRDAELVAGALECLAGCRQSAKTVEAALGVLSVCLEAYSSVESNKQEDYKDNVAAVALLHVALAEGLKVAADEASSAEQIEVARMHVIRVARLAAARPPPVVKGNLLDQDDDVTGTLKCLSADRVLNSAAGTATMVAQDSMEKGLPVQTGTALSCALVLSAVATHDGATQPACLNVLSRCIASQNFAVRAAALRAVASCLESPNTSPTWAAQVTAVVMPPALAVVHATLRSGGATTLQEPNAVIACEEALRVGVLACQLGGDVGDVSLRLVVPMMVESAAPSGQVDPGIVSITTTAVKLLNDLGTGHTSAAFRSTVAALPEGVKGRLQRALAAAAAAGPTGAPAVAMQENLGQRLPAITLKRFA